MFWLSTSELSKLESISFNRSSLVITFNPLTHCRPRLKTSTDSGAFPKYKSPDKPTLDPNNLTTKGESIEFSTPSIEGTVTRRNKVDGQGKHPWKAEVSEDDSGVSSTVITGWYDEVYEPSYADQTAGAGGEG